MDTVEQRSEPFEQGGQLFVFEQSRGDDELTRPAGNQAGIGLDQLLNLRLGGGAVVGRNVRLSGSGRRISDPIRLIRDFRSHLDLLGSDSSSTEAIVRSEAV